MSEVGIRVSQQPGGLTKQVGVQCCHGRAQPGSSVKHLLDGACFPLKGLIQAVAMMLDKGLQAATEVALCDLLERHEITQYLIQTPANALSVLRHEAWHTAAGQHRRDQHQAVKSAADQSHHLTRPRRKESRARGS